MKSILKDKTGKTIAPATRSDMVFRADGKSIENVMLTKEEQVLTPEEQEQVRVNIGAAPKYVPLKDVQQFIDLLPIIGKECYAVYRFDDTGYYVLHSGGFTKLSLDFEKIYTVSLTNYFNRADGGVDKNLCCKIGNNIFLAPSNNTKLVYLYNEDTSEGRYLDNPENLQYYGSVYLVGEKIYYFHRYQSSQIYVYDKDGALINNVANEHGYIKVTEGIAFTRDGFKVNLEDFSFEQITIPETESITDLSYAFANGNYIYSNISITDESNSTTFKFTSLPINNNCGFAINRDRTFTRFYFTIGVWMAIYPYGITNATNRMLACADLPGGNVACFSFQPNGISNYDKFVYMVTPKSILVIENISKYVTD